MRTALVVDDDPGFRGFIVEWLRQNGWRALEAQDGQQAIEMAQAHHPAVVFCDLLMAPVNGFQVCRRLRQLESLRDTRIIVTSGQGFATDRRNAREAGADDYLTKPLDLDRLAASISTVSGSVPVEVVASAQITAPSTPVTLRFWGVRGSVPTPGPATVEYGGNTSCVEVRAEGRIIILDAGTGLRPLGRQLLEEFQEQPLDLVLLLTHTHWDHIQGLPFFMPVYKPQNRLRVVGGEGARLGLDRILSRQMESPFFPVGLTEVPANVTIEELRDLSLSIGPVQVKAAFANHPGVCFGYRLAAAGRSIAFFPDNELRHAAPLPNGSTSERVAAEFARQENEKLSEFVRGADVLIMDTQYDSEEYRQHRGWGHGCLDEVVMLALEAHVGRLFLFHHDPDHDDKKIAEMTAHARDLVAQHHGRLEVEAAREGFSLELAPVGANQIG